MVCRHQHPADDIDGSHHAVVRGGDGNMKYCKKLFALLAAALLCMALTLPAGAAAPLVRDECGVFDTDTLADLEERAESASDGHDVDVYFLVVDDIGDADQRDYAKNYYISNGLGYGDEQSGILFRKTAERICRFYNDYYEIGFPEGTLLEEFLCYTDKEEHNVLVSRFFSTVKDQRDRLNKLRVPAHVFNGRTDVDDRFFFVDWVPDYSEEERFPKKEEEKKSRPSIFSRFFCGKSST